MEYLDLIKRLNARGFKAQFVDDANDANSVIASAISKEERISFGGSMTVAELGLVNYLKENGYNLFIESAEVPRSEIMKTAMHSDVYILSANAIAKTGEIINLDGRGNRISASAFGPKKVVYVVGVNKIVETIEKGVDRVRNIAAPKNAKRLSMNTPCAIDGKCHDCSSPDRICSAFLINLTPLRGMETHVIIINKELGY